MKSIRFNHEGCFFLGGKEGSVDLVMTPNLILLLFGIWTEKSGCSSKECQRAFTLPSIKL